MKKLSLVVLLGLALSAVVSGCNNESTPTTTPAATNSTPAPAAPADTNKP